MCSFKLKMYKNRFRPGLDRLGPRWGACELRPGLDLSSELWWFNPSAHIADALTKI